MTSYFEGVVKCLHTSIMSVCLLMPIYTLGLFNFCWLPILPKVEQSIMFGVSQTKLKSHRFYISGYFCQHFKTRKEKGAFYSLFEGL